MNGQVELAGETQPIELPAVGEKVVLETTQPGEEVGLPQEARNLSIVGEVLAANDDFVIVEGFYSKRQFLLKAELIGEMHKTTSKEWRQFRRGFKKYLLREAVGGMVTRLVEAQLQVLRMEEEGER